MAVPPSLRVSVGVPPVTVTASLRLSVSVTVLPALRSPLAGDSVSEEIVGVGGVDLKRAGRVGHGAGHGRGGAGAIGDRTAVGVVGRDRQVGRVLPSAYGVAEGECIGAGAAGIGGGAAIVEGESRRAAGRVDRHGLAHGDGERHRLADAKVAAAAGDAATRGRHR